MAGFTDLAETKLLDHFFTDPAWSPPATWFIGLSSTTPADDGTGFTEVSGGSYARVSTTATDWSAAVAAAPSTKTNTATLSFPQATADWSAGVNLVAFGLFDVVTLGAGTLYVTGTLTVTRPVLNGDTASFTAGLLVVKLGDPADSY